MPFKFIKTNIPEVIIVEPKVFGDGRGFFMETYKKDDFISFGIEDDFIQDNHSKSSYGVLRGLHYQLPPFEQAKLVRCVRGRILDVAVDIRKKSKTFGKWVSIILSEENRKMLFIPKGFAHGFLTISETAEVVYKVSGKYSPEHERGIIWNDSDIGIDWGMEIENPILSPKDKNWPYLKDTEVL